MKRPAMAMAAALAVLPMLCAVPGAARAEELFPYEVQHGDSLYGVAGRLLEDPRRWPEVAKLNRLAQPSRLRPGQRLLLPASLLKGTARPARAEYVRGPVRAGGETLRIGDAVGEGTVLEVGAQGFVSLRLHDGSLLQLQANSRSRLLRLRDLPVGQRRNTLIELDGGRVDATVAPQSSGSRFEVKTPLATAGVRGTRFGVTVPMAGALATADVVEGRVEVQAQVQAQAQGRRAGDPVALAAGQGAVVRRGAAPQLRPLLPAPPLPGGAIRLERMPGAIPLPAMPDASRYRVEVADDADFTRVLWSGEGPLPLVVEGLADGRYPLRARAIDADGLLGAERVGELWVRTRPVAPLAQSPRPDEIVAPDQVTVDCTSVPGAAGYLLEVSASAGFESPLRRAEARDRCHFALPALPAGELYWRVASVAPMADGRLERGPFSDPGRFAVVPYPVTPAAADIVVDGQRLHWKAAPGYRYRVQIGTDTAFAAVVQDEVVEAGELRLSLPAGCAPYAVRLRAADANGRWSAFSPPRLIEAEASVCSGDGTPVRQSGGGPVRTDR
jgi:hypothetical protein